VGVRLLRSQDHGEQQRRHRQHAGLCAGFTYSDTANTLQIPAYALVGAMVGYDLGGLAPKLEGIVAAANAANVFNTRYVSECSNATNCLYGQGASVLATLRKVF